MTPKSTEDWERGFWSSVNFIPTPSLHFYISTLLASKEKGVIERAIACVPSQAEEYEGWKIVHEENRCCPGDDAAEGFNVCRERILKALNSLWVVSTR